MLIGSTVPIANRATRAMIATHSGPMANSFRAAARVRVTAITRWLSGPANRPTGRLSIGCLHDRDAHCRLLPDEAGTRPAVRAGRRADHDLDRPERPDRRRSAPPGARARDPARGQQDHAEPGTR